MSQPIEDYALIGNCHTAALVSKQGSIDWLCLPYFDSGACFAALVGTSENGHWTITPAENIRSVKRKYRENSLVLETEFETASGVVSLVDCMIPRDDVPHLIRSVIGKRGQVQMKMEFVIRFDYGSVVPWVQSTQGGISALAGPDMVGLRTPVETRGEDFKTLADFNVSEGETIPFDLVWHASNQREPEPVNVSAEIDKTEKWWQEWSRRCTYEGKWRDAVLRSLITLKALTFAPTGGIVAAPTTSLPEALGGVRNWDYRFCWVRDATLTLHALIDAGYLEEARGWRKWLIRAIAGHPSELNIVYGLRGERRLTELELPWLSGYENSKPVRTGNAAYNQFQLDIFGEVGDTMYQYRMKDPEAESSRPGVPQTLVEFLETAWVQPDDGIWEMRGPRRHFTHSKMMAWVAMDRMIKSAEHGWMSGDVAKWKQLRDEIHRQVCSQGFDRQLNSFIQFYGSKHLDASLLMMPLVGFLPAEDARVMGTVAAIEKNLMSPEGFVARYTTDPSVDGLPHGEATFLPCTFWLADNYILQGRREDAARIFEHLLEIRNDVGLLSEEYDPEAKRLLGNFPQAFTHVGQVNTAMNFSRKFGLEK